MGVVSIGFRKLIAHGRRWVYSPMPATSNPNTDDWIAVEGVGAATADDAIGSNLELYCRITGLSQRATVGASAQLSSAGREVVERTPRMRSTATPLSAGVLATPTP